MVSLIAKRNIIALSIFLSYLCLAPAQSFALALNLHIKPGTPHPIIQKIAVLGKDDRRPLPKKHINTAAAIGILSQHGRRGWQCTAFCVAPDIVATNAHCILRNTTVGRRLNLAKTMFILPNLSDKESKTYYPTAFSPLEIVSPKQTSLSVYAGNFVRPHSVKAQGHDWAFTKLRRPICEKRSLKFAKFKFGKLKSLARQNKLFMIGFHGDKKMRNRLYSANCRLRSPTNRHYFLRAQRRMLQSTPTLLPHTCDAYKGSSGSPILVSTKTGIHVVGINLGSIRYERYQINRNPYTGKIIGKRKIKYRRETNMAVRPSAFLKGLGRYENETLLSTLNDFKKVQAYLKELKLYRGRVDGRMGRKTRLAIVKYEQLKNLSPLALPTRELLMHLSETVASINTEQQESEIKQ